MGSRGTYATLGGAGDDDAELVQMVAEEGSCTGRARAWCGLSGSQLNDESQRRRRWLMITTALFFLAAVLVLIGFVLVVWQYDGESPPEGLKTTVLLISIDGFRNEYLSRSDVEMPHIRSLIQQGVVLSNGLIASFPSKTFPNHYTVVTGLYPESHGIVSNTMYDPVFNATFSIRDSKQVTDGRWWGGEPLWVTAEKQGQRAGTYFWPGSEAEIKGYRPSYYVPYNGATPYESRVNQVLEWLDYGVDERPTFLTLYFEGVDTQGHYYGPNSTEVVQAIEAADAALGKLIAGLKERDMFEAIDIILVSDHGMTALSPERVIRLQDYINPATVRVVNDGPVLMIIPNNLGDEQQLVNTLQNAHPNMSAYLKQDLPARFHYNDNRRITPIVGVMDLGWVALNGDAAPIKGDHGYDPEYTDMRAIFVGRGPHFKSGVKIEKSFQNIEIYTLMARILGLTPAANNGTLAHVEAVLKQ